jgi:hypothetical protein
MADFQVRSDSIDVEQIMRQIRARIREKRGADYTEAELEQLATVKLERFLDPRGVRSDLVDQFRRRRVVAEAPPNYEFEESTLFETHRGLLRSFRRLLRPILKLFFNPDKITSALHIQSQVNTQAERRLRHLEEREPLYYELIHNLVVEVTRLGIEAQNLKMRVESLSSRVDFDERRARALEGVVQYKPAAPQPQPQRGGPPRPAATPPPPAQPAQPVPQAAAAQTPGAPSGTAPEPRDAGTSGERRRRRRRRRRRPGQTMAQSQGATAGAPDGAAGLQAGGEVQGAALHDTGGVPPPGGAPPGTGGAPNLQVRGSDEVDAPDAADDDWSDEDDDRGPGSGTSDQ